MDYLLESAIVVIGMENCLEFLLLGVPFHLLAAQFEIAVAEVLEDHAPLANTDENRDILDSNPLEITTGLLEVKKEAPDSTREDLSCVEHMESCIIVEVMGSIRVINVEFLSLIEHVVNHLGEVDWYGLEVHVRFALALESEPVLLSVISEVNHLIVF
jgi:hypothetical protein